MKNKKMLIAGGSYADIPLILSAKRLGYHVFTSGNRLEDLGHQYSDGYHEMDYSNREGLLALARRLEVDAVCASCNDFSALSCAYTAEKMGLPGHDSYKTAELIHHKDQYRKFASENKIPAPKSITVSNPKPDQKVARFVPFPWIVKPVDMTGGKGISLVDSENQMGPALNKAVSASRQDRVVIEQFIPGSRHGFSSFIYRGRVVFCFSDNEHYFVNPFLVSAASTPSTISSDVEAKLCQISEKIASLLKLVNGIFHIQYILKEGEPVIIEICRRAPGDLYIKFVEHATGISYSDWIVRASAGLDCAGLSMVKPRGYFVRHCVMSPKAGKIKDVVFDASIKNKIIDRMMWWKPGEVLGDFMTAKLGIVFLKFDSQKEMFDAMGRIQELITVEVE